MISYFYSNFVNACFGHYSKFVIARIMFWIKQFVFEQSYNHANEQMKGKDVIKLPKICLWKIDMNCSGFLGGQTFGLRVFRPDRRCEDVDRPRSRRVPQPLVRPRQAHASWVHCTGKIYFLLLALTLLNHRLCTGNTFHLFGSYKFKISSVPNSSRLGWTSRAEDTAS